MRTAVVRRLHRLRHELQGLAPPSRTVLRVPVDRRPPRPSEFGRFGERSFVVPPVRVTGVEAIEIGDDVLVHEESGLHVAADRGARLVIGDRTRLGPGTEIVCTVGVEIGTAVSTSDYVALLDTWAALDHPPGAPPPPAAPVVVEDGAYLGWGSIVGPGVRIGAGAFVGEGAVVFDDVAPHTVVYGNPAVVVRRLDPDSHQWEGTHVP